MTKEEIRNVDAFALMQAIAMAQEEKMKEEEKEEERKRERKMVEDKLYITVAEP